MAGVFLQRRKSSGRAVNLWRRPHVVAFLTQLCPAANSTDHRQNQSDAIPRAVVTPALVFKSPKHGTDHFGTTTLTANDIQKPEKSRPPQFIYNSVQRCKQEGI